jgi:S-adenosylmethionine:tRNA ribosyltransferase-isomerase
MRLADFDYELPSELIAARPIRPRDAARLLRVGASLEDRIVRDLPQLLTPGDLLVVNDTRVIPARLLGRRGAAGVEITLTREESDGYWRALAKPLKRLRIGDEIAFGPGFAARVLAVGQPELYPGEVRLDFGLERPAFRAALARCGSVPLPPYIPRETGADAADRDDYQTMFARVEGAVAAPTAGLHFTADLLAALATRGLAAASVTLHVGPGTFLPVRDEDVQAHRLHPEWGEVSAATAASVARTRASGGRILAVGTTTLRILETAARAAGHLEAFQGYTDLFILPGFEFRVADLLLTNFHLPKSSLLMLVTAFAGPARIRAAYAHAIRHRYRFYSYGDCCLLERAR